MLSRLLRLSLAELYTPHSYTCENIWHYSSSHHANRSCCRLSLKCVTEKYAGPLCIPVGKWSQSSHLTFWVCLIAVPARVQVMDLFVHCSNLLPNALKSFQGEIFTAFEKTLDAQIGGSLLCRTPSLSPFSWGFYLLIFLTFSMMCSEKKLLLCSVW